MYMLAAVAAAFFAAASAFTAPVAVTQPRLRVATFDVSMQVDCHAIACLLYSLPPPQLSPSVVILPSRPFSLPRLFPPPSSRPTPTRTPASGKRWERQRRQSLRESRSTPRRSSAILLATSKGRRGSEPAPPSDSIPTRPASPWHVFQSATPRPRLSSRGSSALSSPPTSPLKRSMLPPLTPSSSPQSPSTPRGSKLWASSSSMCVAYLFSPFK